MADFGSPSLGAQQLWKGMIAPFRNDPINLVSLM
jgi:hypothetical protein